MKNYYFSFVIFSIVLLSSLPCCIAKILRLNNNGEFVILQLTDLHFGESKDVDELNLHLMEKLIKQVKPDLVVLTGDMLSGWYWDSDSETKDFFEYHWKIWTSVFTNTQTYYAYLLGNHDSEANLNRREIMGLDMKHPYSLSGVSSVELSGASTYTLDIFSHNDYEKIATRLWMFDSGRSGCGNIQGGDGCVEKDLINWYNQKSLFFKQEYGTEALHLAFFHIPLPEYVTLADNYPVSGKKEEDVCCPLTNSGLFEAAVKNGDIKAMFCGHDHVNDYSGVMEGIELNYGRKTGHGSYGPSKATSTKKGARIIKLKEKLENGKLNITMEHDIINEEGVVEEKKPSVMIDSKQYSCHRYKALWEKYKIIALLSFGILGMLVFRFLRRYRRKKQKYFNVV